MKSGIRIFTVCFAAAVLLLGSLSVQAGFQKRTDVFAVDFSVSEDGRVVTVSTSLSSPMGYVRKMECRRAGNKLYATFYNCFGGLNSSFGAKHQFSFDVDDGCDEILFYRGGGTYAPQLEKNPVVQKWVLVPVSRKSF